MKKFMVIFVLLVAIVLTGCGGNKNTREVSTKEPERKEQVQTFENSTTYFEDAEVDQAWEDYKNGKVSKEYYENLEYNSRKNVYPEN